MPCNATSVFDVRNFSQVLYYRISIQQYKYIMFILLIFSFLAFLLRFSLIEVPIMNPVIKAAKIDTLIIAIISLV